MFDSVIRAIAFSSMPISGYFVIRRFLNNKDKILSIKNIIILIMLTTTTWIFFDKNYGALITIMNFCVITIGYKFIFNIKYSESFVLSLVLMLLMVLAEMLLCIVVLPLSTTGLTYFRDSILFGNVSVGIICVLLSRLKFVYLSVVKLMKYFSNMFKLQTVVIAFFWILIIAVFGYVIFTSSVSKATFWLSILVVISFGVFLINYFIDKRDYESLNENFDKLYNYIETMEEYIDNEQLNIHEYKNQLTVISNMTTNKKIKDYINSLVDNNIEETSINSKLKYLPSGGLKGLIYYKLVQANSKGIDVIVDISKNCTNSFKNISINNMKEISRIIGILLDNAIEAADSINDKNITLEIYSIKKQINIIVSNKVNSAVDIEKIKHKGVTTKGKGRGKGLYLASKIIKRNESLDLKTSIINDYFVQKFIIYTK